VKLYRARAWRGGLNTFDALDSAPSIAGPKGWRFNDLTTEILYAAEVEALATLEVAVRPGWETIQQVLIATIEIPDDSLAPHRPRVSQYDRNLPRSHAPHRLARTLRVKYHGLQRAPGPVKEIRDVSQHL